MADCWLHVGRRRFVPCYPSMGMLGATCSLGNAAVSATHTIHIRRHKTRIQHTKLHAMRSLDLLWRTLRFESGHLLVAQRRGLSGLIRLWTDGHILPLVLRFATEAVSP